MAIQGLLWFHTNIRIVCSSFAKKKKKKKNAGGILIGIALNLWISLGGIDILTIFVLPIYEHGMSFHFFVTPPISSMFYSFQSTSLSPL